MIDKCYSKAIEVLKKNSTSSGFKASFEHYNSVWGRDGGITCIAANLTGNKKLMKTSRATIESLGKNQSKHGQIPCAIFLKGKQPGLGFDLKKELIYWYATDATLWWIISVWNYFRITNDRKFLLRLWPSVEKAMKWLGCQKLDNSDLITSPSAADWMDSSIARRGKVLYNNFLWYKAVRCANEMAEELKKEGFDNEEKIKKMINIFFWPTKGSKNILLNTGFVTRTEFYEEAINPKRKHHLHFISLEWYEDRCDVLASSLSIIWGITDKVKTRKIIEYFSEKRLSDPYPVKVLNPPVWISSYLWNPKIDLYRRENQRNLPFHYHNAGIWPYVGGFYILALIKAGKRRIAEKELEKLAQANRLGKKQKWEFNEWLHGKTGEPRGAILQSWSAAGFILAYKAVTEKKFLLI